MNGLPDSDYAARRYVGALLRRSLASEALWEIDRLGARAPDDPGLKSLRALALAQLGREDEALTLYEEVLAARPGAMDVRLAQGRALAALGRVEEALAAWRLCLSDPTTRAEAWWRIADARIERFTPQEVETMRALYRRGGLAPREFVHLGFALARAADEAGDFADAFTLYARANAARRASLRYDPARAADHVARSRALLTAAFFEARRAPDPADESLGREALFIVGLPKSGSTLIEQILASHSAVEATAELPHIALLARRLGLEAGLDSPEADRSSYPEVLAGLNRDDLARLGEAYLAAAQPYRRLGRPLFIDKAPNNVFHLGLIRLALPGARIIDARRGALACCVSCFTQHFAAGQAFACDLAELGRYYGDYVALMDHWDAALPRGVVRVTHEALVADPAGEIGRLLAALDLPPEAACFEAHRNPRAVRTPSAQQVRRPIHGEGVESWRRFEPWLDPLGVALGPLAAETPRAGGVL